MARELGSGPAVSSLWGRRDIMLKPLTYGIFALALAAGAGSAFGISSYAYVGGDGSLRIKGRTFRLHGLFIPPTAYTCQRFTTPFTCSSQVNIALDFKIGSKFVRCDTVAMNPDGTESAYCSVDGEDLGAYLLSEGWALALPWAPIEYVMFEHLARGRGVGVWANPNIGIYQYPR